ncbi:hypothetical protein EXIGLDRAFT_847228 [Exidia glandulosa HHB12029]|uniref:Uncharacterized protein n=1 Tax=Exidia glandulosa HHB12029 TaxID=1314781 RepID=A0A166N3T6_EXIGL|nr:hypothetical protein EXIGLDRAFT_847228 [Exidia glandulosa HHB12029]
MDSYEVYDIDLESGHVTPHESQSQSQSQYEETQPEGSQDWVASQISNIGVSFSCSSVTDEVVLHHIKETYKGAYNSDWWFDQDKGDDDAVTVQMDSGADGSHTTAYSQESSVSETPGPQLFPSGSGLTADDSTVTQEDANSQTVPDDVGGSQTQTQTSFYPNSDTTSATYAGSFSGSQMYSNYTDSQTSTFVDSSQSTGRGYDADGEATTSDSDMTYSPSSTLLFGSQSQSQGSGLDTSTPGVDIYDPLTFDVSPGVTHAHYEDIDPSSQGSEAPVDENGRVYTQLEEWVTAEEFEKGGYHRNGRVRTPLVRTPSPDPE